MKTRKVGLLTLATMMIVFGVLMLLYVMRDLRYIEVAIRYMPLFLILLGFEILYFFLAGDEEVRFNFFSVLMVLLVVTLSSLVYVGERFNILDQAIHAIHYDYGMAESEEDSIEIPENIKKIRILHDIRPMDGREYSSTIVVKKSMMSRLNLKKSLFAEASSDEVRNQRLMEYMTEKRIDRDTMFIVLKSENAVSESWPTTEVFQFDVAVPKGIDVDLAGFSMTDVNLHELESNLTIDETKHVMLLGARDSDYRIEAHASSPFQLYREPLAGEEAFQEESPVKEYKEQIGKGTYHIEIREAESINIKAY